MQAEMFKIKCEAKISLTLFPEYLLVWLNFEPYFIWNYIEILMILIEMLDIACDPI